MSRDYRLGLFGSRSDRRGLAQQTLAFAQHMRPDQIIGIEMNDERCPSDWSVWDGHELTILDAPNPAQQIHAAAINDVVGDWFSTIDVCFFAETSYTDEVYAIARAAGCRTIVQANPEFARWDLLGDSERGPDIVWNPTPWRMEMMPGAIHVPFPVDRDRFPPRHVTSVGTWLHPIGRPALGDRAGSRLLAHALRFVHEPIRVLVRCQSGEAAQMFRPNRYPTWVDIRIVDQDVPDHRDLYAGVDGIILPRRYGGQSLILNEAASLGLPIVSTDLSPQNEWIPSDALLRARARRRYRMPGGIIDAAEADPRGFAAILDRFSTDAHLAARCSAASDAYARSISWDLWRGRYEEMFAIAADPVAC